MATPLKTGSNIYLPKYGCYHRADVYKIGTCYIFICSQPLYEKIGEVSANVELDHTALDRLSQGYRMIAVPEEQVEILGEW